MQAFEGRGTADGFMRWCTILSGVCGASSNDATFCGAGDSSSGGVPSFLVVVTLHQMAHLSVVLVVLLRMAQSVVWFCWRFIKWRTFL